MLSYLIMVVEKTRTHPKIAMGVSPRGSQALLKAIQVQAIVQGRDYVIPDDLKTLIKPVFAHRMVLATTIHAQKDQREAVLDEVLKEVPVPTEELLVKA